MPFDPDQYLNGSHADANAQAQGNAFDPDAYLANNPVPIQEEMHPDLSWKDRAVVKNLSSAPDEGSQQNIDYLQKQHPGLQFSNYQGRLLAKRPEETTWRPLDPQNSLLSDPKGFLKDLPYDVTDAVGDLGEGAAQAIGHTVGSMTGAGVGGLAGGAAGSAIPGVGNAAGAISGALTGYVGGGAAGSGAAEYGANLLKQKLGQWAGVNPEMDWNQAKDNAKLAAAVPVMGSAASGLYKGLMTQALPKAGWLFSGVPSDAAKTAYERLPEMNKLDQGYVSNFANDAWRKVVQPLRSLLEQKGQELADHVDSSGNRVDAREAKAAIGGLLEKYRNTPPEFRTPTMDQAMQDIHSTYQQLFNLGGPEGVDVQTLLKDKSPGEQQAILNGLKINTIPGELGARNASEQYYQGKPNFSGVSFKTNEIPDSLTARQAWDLQKQIGHAADMFKLKPTDQAISPRGLFRMTQPDQEMTLGLDSAYRSLGTGLENATSQIMTKAPGELSPTEKLRIFANAKTPQDAQRQIQTVVSSQTLKDEYKDIADTLRKLNPYFGNEQQTFRTLSNLDGASYRTLSDALGKVRDRYGIDIAPDVQLIRAQKFLGEPGGYIPGIPRELPMSPISTRGVTGTARALSGAYAGGALADQAYSTLMTDNDAFSTDQKPADKEPTPSWVVNMGRLAGATASSPWATKRGIQAVRAGEWLPRTIGKAATSELGETGAKLLGNTALHSAWQMMPQAQRQSMVDSIPGMNTIVDPNDVLEKILKTNSSQK